MTKAKLWVQTDGNFLILLAIMLLLLPLRWVLAVVFAACFHELCHYVVVCLLGGTVYGLRLGLGGAKMELEPMLPWKETIAALAGPIGSALLMLPVKWMPRLAICGFIHCVFNLLPLFPLDGGRVLRGLLDLIFPDGRGERIFSYFQSILHCFLGAVCILIAFQWGLVPAILGAYLVWRQRKKRII